jgi:superfamily II DNA/RNA helicase
LTVTNYRLAILSLLCNHPECFNAKLHDRKKDARNELVGGAKASNSRDGTDLDEVAKELNAAVWKVGVSQDLINEETKLFKEEAPDMNSIDLSNKVKILCQILDASKLADDKVLVFSQSIPTLDFLEKLCIRQGRKFARLDGSTPMAKRQDMIKDFNKGDTDIYLISTAAGGLGLNLPSANRVIIFDFKWNPIMEEQAVGRAYRIGQTKPTYVYRFVAGGTFEDSVHNKTVFKMQLASRVIDKKNPIAYASRKLSDYLFEPRDVPQKDLSEFVGMDPLVLDKILDSQEHNPVIRSIVQSDTFERDDDDKLTAEELKEVKQLLSDEQLKRSDPRKWGELQLKRSQQLHKEAQRQGLALQYQRPVQTNIGSANHPLNAGQGMHLTIPILSGNGLQDPSLGLPTVVNSTTPPAQVSKQSTRNQNQVAGPLTLVDPSAEISEPALPRHQDQSFERGRNLSRHKTPVSGNYSHRTGSPIHGANTKAGEPPSENGEMPSLPKNASSPILKTLPRNVPVREGSGTPESQKKV